MQFRMDWRSVKFDWNRARAFLVTAEEGSLSAAARALGMAQPTLGRQVAALEEELGVILFERVGRGLALTPGGLELVDHVRAMADAAGRVSLAASGQSQSVAGSVCLSASEIYATFRLPPIVARLRRLEPKLTIEIIASNALSDLRRREADIAIRNVRPSDPALIARKLGDDGAALYATEDYLARIGTPKTPADLSGAEFIGFDDLDQVLIGLNQRGFDLTRSNFTVSCDDHVVHWELVKQSIGISIFPTWLGDAAPDLVRVLPDMEPLVYPIWLTAHRDLATSRRVRLVFDLLVEALRSDGEGSETG